MLSPRPARPVVVFLATHLFISLCIANGSNQSLPRSTPEAEGIPSESIIKLIDNWESNSNDIHSFMILRHGKVVSEAWWAPYSAELPHTMYSVSKSFTSTAIGMAINERLLSLDDTVISFFPEQAPLKPSWNLSQMRIRDLLTMTSGHREDTIGTMLSNSESTMVESFMELEVEDKPGTHFIYNTGATYMLAAILQKVTGQKLSDYLQTRLFTPLAFEQHHWSESPAGISFGGFGLNLRTEDLAKFGQLYLQEGEWQGKQLISKTWIQEATSKQTSNGSNPDSNWDQGYGYQFWRNTYQGSYRGDGAFGQFVIVSPADDLVVVITSGTNDMGAIIDEIWKTLIPKLSNEKQLPSTSAQKKLIERTTALARPQIKGSSASPAEDGISGATYSFEDNDLGIGSVRFDFGENNSRVTIAEVDGTHSLSFGREGWGTGATAFMQSKLATFSESAKYTALGKWNNERQLELQIIFTETPYQLNLLFEFEEDTIAFWGQQNVGFGTREYEKRLGHRNL